MSAALQFQPTRRPTRPQQQKARPGFFKSAATAPTTSSSSPDASARGLAAPPAPPINRTTFSDWIGDEDDDVNGYYNAQQREKAGRKKRKKNQKEEVVLNWDDIYDPARPNTYIQWKDSDEKDQDTFEWRQLLSKHRRNRHSSASSSDDGRRERTMNGRFAPPSNYEFAPPSDMEVSSDIPPPPPPDLAGMEDDATGEDAYARRMRLSKMQQQLSFAPPVEETLVPSLPPPPPEPAHVPDDATGQDAYARRLGMSIIHQQELHTPPFGDIPPPPPPPETEQFSPPPPPPPPPPPAVISRAPILYNLPEAPAEIPSSEAELEEMMREENEFGERPAEYPMDNNGPSASRPKPKGRGVAQALMAKWGYAKGQGLGASGTGITTALKVKLDKRKQRPDAEGGGFVGPGGRGQIIGGKRKGQEELGKYGAMSEVVVCHGMVNGLNLEVELGPNGELVQEIGEECGQKYGNVERIFVHRNSSAESVPIFIKFTSPLSALRAVNALDGRSFNGNTIRAKFFDTDKFEAGDYEPNET